MLIHHPGPPIQQKMDLLEVSENLCSSENLSQEFLQTWGESIVIIGDRNREGQRWEADGVKTLELKPSTTILIDKLTSTGRKTHTHTKEKKKALLMPESYIVHVR